MADTTKAKGPARKSEGVTLEAWIARVDGIVTRKVGFSVHDLPDMMFADGHDDDMSPAEFYREVVAEVIEEQGGFE